MSARLTDFVSALLQERPLPHHYGGTSHASKDGRAADVFNPSDGSVLTQVAMASAGDVDAAMQAAEAAAPAWANTPPAERAVRLHRWAELMEKHTKDLGQLEALDVGKPLPIAEGYDVPAAIGTLRYFADLAAHASYSEPIAVKNIEARTFRVPYGACGLIFPWNFPYLLFLGGVAPALAAGNTVVVKPSEITPITTILAARLATESGLPPGVLNVVVGDGPSAGAPLVNHPLAKRVAFTGSLGVGRAIGESCGRRLVPCKLELGGKGAAVVCEDVNVDFAAQSLADALTFNTGQVCCTATRWILHERIFDAFLAKATERLKQTQIGPAFAAGTQIGPLVSQVQRERVLGYVERGKAQHAEVLLDGGPVAVAGGERGYFVSPVLLGGAISNVCFREEIFGPVAFVARFRNEDEALQLVNGLDYGLGNSVWTTDLQRANRIAERMIAGNNWINAHNVFADGLPYRSAKQSGIGNGTYSPETFYDYLRQQTIARPL